MGETAPSDARRHVHDALLYDSPAELAAVAAPFLLDGLAAGDAAVIATSAATADLLREAVGNDSGVHVLDRGDVGEVLRQVQGSKSSSHRQSEYGQPRRKKESFLSDLFG